MCSIMGCFGSMITEKEFRTGFDKTISRGPDMSRMINLPGNNFMGFHRLSIMGLEESGMQPFSLDNRNLVCNGEIYGFRPLKEELINKAVCQRLGLRNIASALQGIRHGDV